jgi:glycosyltransferase involved in cell wall biosynthesis
MLKPVDFPLVSIILPTYNQANYLPATLDSICRQTYHNFELIVVNDGSTDRTPQVLEEYHLSCPYRIIHQQNKKLPGALNTGFTEAHGQYLTWTSSDNILLPNMLAVLVEALNKNPEIGLVYADWETIDQNGNFCSVVHTLDYDPYILMRKNFVNACFLYRRECQEKVGLYNPEYIYAEDWEYWYRISRKFKMCRVPEVLYQYRIHQDSMTSTGVLTQKRGKSTGYLKLYKDFRSNPFRWYYSKLKWELLMRSQRPMEQAYAAG